MTTAETIASYFTTYHIISYLFIIFVGMVVWYEWRWAKDCKEYIQVLIAEKGGGGSFKLARKDGGEVSIHNPHTGMTRTWPVNELATIDVLYPGVGFVPGFLQKTIRLAIVNEGDWEPMLNRSPHMERIASPDIVKFLNGIHDDKGTSEEMKGKIEQLVSQISTGPTREMIADPAILGSLQRSSVMKALATVSNELVEAMKSLNSKLSRAGNLNPMVVYIGMGLTIVLLAVLLFQLLPALPGLQEVAGLDAKFDAVLKALGAAGAIVP